MLSSSIRNLSRLGLAAGASLVTAAFSSSTASASTLYFGTGTGLWETAGNWFTDATGTTASALAPTGTDNAVFNISSLNTGTTTTNISLNAAETIDGLTFNNSGALSISGTGGNRNLTIGASGITLSATTGAITIGNSGANLNILVKLGASQTWTNNSANGLLIRNSAAGSTTASGPITLTFNAAGVGGITDSGALSDGNTSVSVLVASTGAGVTSIAGGNWSGGTTIKSGALSITSAPSGTGAILLGDASGTYNSTLTLSYAGNTANNLTVQTGNTGTSILSLSNSSLTYSGTITLNRTLVLSGNIGSSVSGVITGTGGLTKGVASNTVVTLSGSNNYTGLTTLASGTLALSNANALAGGGNITFTGGVLQFAGANQVDYSSRIKNSTSAVSIDPGAAGLTLNGGIDSSNTAGFLKTGTGVLTLYGTNSYLGNTALGNGTSVGGTLAIGGSNVLSSGTLVIGNTSTLQSDSSTARTLANNVVFNTANLLTIGGTGDLSFGTLQLISGTRNIAVNNGMVTFANTSNDASARTLVKTGTGAMVVTGTFQSGGSIIQDGIIAVTGSYGSTGNINLQGGMLGLSGTFSRNLGTGASQTQFTGNGGFAATGTSSTWGAASNNLTVSLASGSSLAYGTASFLASGQTLLLGSTVSNGTVNVRNGLDFAGATQTVQVARGASAPTGGVDAILSGTLANGGLTKTGAGVLAVTANNTYTGATTVSAGTLIVGVSGSGSLGNTAVTVASGATLGGSGSIAGSVTIQDGGAIAPGNSPGTLSTGDLTLSGTGSAIVMEITGTGAGAYDQINVTGAVNLNGNGAIQIALSYSPAFNDIFFPILNDSTDAINGTLFNLAQGATFSAGGYLWKVSYTGDSAGKTFTGGNDLALQVVPEPQTWALITAGGVAVVVLRRRRALV